MGIARDGFIIRLLSENVNRFTNYLIIFHNLPANMNNAVKSRNWQGVCNPMKKESRIFALRSFLAGSDLTNALF